MNNISEYESEYEIDAIEPEIDDAPRRYCHKCGDEIPPDSSECGCDNQ